MPCLKNYDAPYCQKGVTFAFWLRPFKAHQLPYTFSSQGVAGAAGFTVQSWRLAASGDIRLDIYLEPMAAGYFCGFDLGTISKSDGRFWKEWTFIGTTYDPSTSRYYCIFDDQLIEMEPRLNPSSIQGMPLRFGNDQNTNNVFLLDDIIYIPAFSNQEAVNVLYNQTKWISYVTKKLYVWQSHDRLSFYAMLRIMCLGKWTVKSGKIYLPCLTRGNFDGFFQKMQSEQSEIFKRFWSLLHWSRGVLSFEHHDWLDWNSSAFGTFDYYTRRSCWNWSN